MCFAFSFPFPVDLYFGYLALRVKVSDALLCSTEGKQECVRNKLALQSVWVLVSSNIRNIYSLRFQLQRYTVSAILKLWDTLNFTGI